MQQGGVAVAINKKLAAGKQLAEIRGTNSLTF
jgi:hypothetical protein